MVDPVFISPVVQNSVGTTFPDVQKEDVIGMVDGTVREPVLQVINEVVGIIQA